MDKEMIARERLRTGIKLNELFNEIESVRNWGFGYFEIRGLFNRNIFFEIKLEMSSDDYISYNVMNELLGEESLKKQIKESLDSLKEWHYIFNRCSRDYYFKIKLCDRIGK